MGKHRVPKLVWMIAKSVSSVLPSKLKLYTVVAVATMRWGPSWIDRLMPPLVTGSVVAIIGLNLAGTVVSDTINNELTIKAGSDWTRLMNRRSGGRNCLRAKATRIEWGAKGDLAGPSFCQDSERNRVALPAQSARNTGRFTRAEFL